MKGKEDGKKYVAVFHGCLGDEFVNMKKIKTPHLQKIINTIIEKECVPVILGNKLDYKRFWKHVDLSHPSIVNYLNKVFVCRFLVEDKKMLKNDVGMKKIYNYFFFSYLLPCLIPHGAHEAPSTPPRTRRDTMKIAIFW